MTGWIGIAALAAAAMQDASAVPPAAGPPVELMVLREITGDAARPGASVTLAVNRATPVPGGVIPYGTPAFGEVVSAQHTGIAMRRGAVAIRLTRLVIDGHDVALSGGYASRGRGGEGDDAVKLLIVPVYALFAPGNVGKVKAGQIIEGRLPEGFSLVPAAPAR